MLKDRISTRELLRRKHMHLDSYNCVHCTVAVEDLFHLFFHCPLAVACWYTLQLIVPATNDIFQIIEAFKVQLHLPFFLDIIITVCWSIWTIRNDVIFRGIPASVQICKQIFHLEFALVILRAKETSRSDLVSWLEAFV